MVTYCRNDTNSSRLARIQPCSGTKGGSSPTHRNILCTPLIVSSKLGLKSSCPSLNVVRLKVTLNRSIPSQEERSVQRSE